MKNRDETFRIGDLASMFGLTARTIRYYEELGLLKSADRSEGLHRRYPGKTIIHLRRIAQLKTYGLSLGEIKEFFALAAYDRTGEACRQLLIRTYGERIEAEEKLIREAEARLEVLRREMRRFESAENFFECPGRQCQSCLFAESCSAKEEP